MLSTLTPSRTVVTAAAAGLAGMLSARFLTSFSSTASAATKDMSDRSTTSSGGGGPLAYETKKAVDEYLQFHFGGADDLIPSAYGDTPVRESLNFTARIAGICTKHATGNGRALDIGCSVGGSAFELARTFEEVVGLDFSQHFIDAANVLKAEGSMPYTSVIEGDITEDLIATVAVDEPTRLKAKFDVGDACALPDSLGKFDCILAANLLCRLPTPFDFLNRLPQLTTDGGIVTLISPYSWLPGWTEKSNWVGGYITDNGTAAPTAAAVQTTMERNGFKLIHEDNVSFLIREHARKFQWGVSHATVWKKE